MTEEQLKELRKVMLRAYATRLMTRFILFTISVMWATAVVKATLNVLEK